MSLPRQTCQNRKRVKRASAAGADMNDPNQDTVTDVEPQNFALNLLRSPSVAVRIDFAATTHLPERVRTTNEDQYAIVRRTRSTDVITVEQTSPRMRSTPPTTSPTAWRWPRHGIRRSPVGGGCEPVGDPRFMLELSGQATSWIKKVTDIEGRSRSASRSKPHRAARAADAAPASAAPIPPSMGWGPPGPPPISFPGTP